MKLAVKLMIEFAPLAIFFVVSTHYDPRTGTAVFMAATVVSVAVMRHLFAQVAMMALITAGTGLVAGAITVALGRSLVYPDEAHHRVPGILGHSGCWTGHGPAACFRSCLVRSSIFQTGAGACSPGSGWSILCLSRC